MAILGGLIKTKAERESERQIAVLNAVSEQKRLIRQLQKHEHEYMKKAVQAKRQKDTVNSRRLCAMVAQTVIQRRNMESQLLFFETLQQTKDKVRIFGEYAKGLKAMANSIGDVYQDFNVADIMKEINRIMNQSVTMEAGMSAVMDKIAMAGDSIQESAEAEGIHVSEIEKTVNELADAEDSVVRLDSSIDDLLKRIEDEIAQKTELSVR